jgi:hypothetical protein
VSLATKLDKTPRETSPPSLPEDVRARRPSFLARGPLKAAARRIGSVASLLILDVTGLALGVYAALGLREIVTGSHPILWGLIWRDSESNWLPFLALVLVLVFWQKGLYAERERRGGIGQIVAALVIVTALTFAFVVGTHHHFTTFAIFPTALVFTTVLIDLRASYDVVTRDIFRLTGLRRRAVLVGTGDNVARLHRSLGPGRGGVEYEFLGAIAPSQAGVDLPRLGAFGELPAVLEKYDLDELIVTDSDLDADQLFQLIDEANRSGVKVRIAAKTTELLTQRVEYIPGQPVPLFECGHPPCRHGLALVKRGFDITVSVLVAVLGLPLWLLIGLAIKLSPGRSSTGPACRPRRARVRDAEVPHDVADAAEQQGELERSNEVGGPLFKIRDDPRMTRVGRRYAGSRSTRSRRC